MPEYDYKCKNCNKIFSIYRSMNDSKDNIKCEYCKGSDVYRIYGNIITKTKSNENVTSSSSCSSCSGGSCSSCH